MLSSGKERPTGNFTCKLNQHPQNLISHSQHRNRLRHILSLNNLFYCFSNRKCHYFQFSRNLMRQLT